MDKIDKYTKDITEAAESNLPWHLLNGKSVLVVGATGLIGSCVIDILMRCNKANCHVFAGGRNIARAKKLFHQYEGNKNFTFLELDITKPINSNDDFNFIIDAASGANPILYSTDPVGVMKANFNGVDNLLSYGLKHKLQKLVYVSSGEVYGEGDGRKFTESYSGYVDPTEFRSCYPSSKRAAETLCVCYAHQYGIDISIARPSHVYGPHFTDSDSRVYAQFIRNVIKGENIVMKSTGSQFRSWCYVVDCASALLYILLKGKNCEAYNIADDTSNISIRQLAELVAGIAGKKVITKLPDNIEEAGFAIVTKAVFDTQKLEGLGWKISGNIKEKMTATIEEAKTFTQQGKI